MRSSTNFALFTFSNQEIEQPKALSAINPGAHRVPQANIVPNNI